MIKQIGAAALLCSTVLAGAANAQTWDFSQDRTYVFGDSLSDTGNILLATGGGGPPVYFNGRFSNGPVWFESLTGGPLALSPFLGGVVGDASNGINFAHGGARTAGFNIAPGGPILPGSIEQAQAYAGLVGSGQVSAPTSNDLFAIWIGGNNFLSTLSGGGSVDINQGVADIQTTLSTLAGAGAQRFLLFSVPPIGTTVDVPAPFDAQLDLAAAQFNLGLRGVDAAVSAQYGVDILYINVEDLMLDVFRAPELYGFTEVETDCVSQGLLLTDCPANWSDYDGIHPTTQAHAVLTQFVIASGANVDYAAQTLGGFSELAYQLNRDMISTGLDDIISERRNTGAYVSAGWLEGETDAETGRAGLDYDGWQASIGYTAQVTESIFVGGRAAYADISSDITGMLGGSSDGERFGVGVYAGWNGEAIYLLASAGIGETSTNTVRATGFAPRASVDGQLTVSNTYTALEAGYGFTGEGWALTPYLRGVFNSFDGDPYTERGVLLAGRAEAFDFDSTLLEAGIRGDWHLSYTQRLGAMLAYQAEDDAERNLGLLLNDIDLSQAQIEAADDSLLRARLGYAFALKDNLEIGLQAGGRFGDATTNYDLQLTARKAF